MTINKSRLFAFVGCALILNFQCTARSWAESRVLVRTENSSSRDYLIALEADRGLKSLPDSWSQRESDEIIRRQMRQAFARAQEIFLQSEVGEMRKEWADVAAFSLQADWSPKYRKLIQTAQLRCAQLSTNASENEHWLKLALSFDPQFEPKRALFPPPLIEAYHKLRTSMHRISIEIGPGLGFERLLLNGVAYNLTQPKKLYLPAGLHRVTYLSSEFMPVTRLLETAKIARFRPDKVPLVSGTCANPEVTTHPSLSHMNLALFFDKSCIIYAHNSEKDAQSSSLGFISHTPVKYSDFNGIDATNPSGLSVAKEPPFYKKSWFWLGATIIAGGVLIYSQQQQQRSSPAANPTTTEGF